MKYLSLVFIVIFSCSNPKTSNTEIAEDTSTIYFKLNKDVMQIHDEAMRESSRVLKLKSKINGLLDSTDNLTQKDNLKEVSALLYKADRQMLEWMHQYKEPKNVSDSVIYNYLLNQKELIENVHQITFEAINKAESILNNEK